MATKITRITIDEKLLEAVDKLISKLETTRSAFICDLIRADLRKRWQKELERRDAEEYRKQQQKPEEFAVGRKHLDWGDDW